MERLMHLPVSLVDWEVVTVAILDALTEELWGDELDEDVDWDAHERYLAELTNRFGFATRLMPWLREVRKADVDGYLGSSITHGDPTFSNVMLRPVTGGLFDVVLCDPIPARPELPQLRSFDAGKVLQSVYGYEAVRFNWRVPDVSLCEESVFNAMTDDEEGNAAQYFAFFHLLRAMKYCDKRHVDAIRYAVKYHLDRIGR